ncbi:MAG: peptidylprolyl isomerase [Nanoarchaeota archaeon]|nr:peptidylprolyl isomerase [Nanoarchaeota archaeon]
MALKKNDFIEIEFIAKIKDGGVFDTNIKEELEKLNPQAKAAPFVFSIGHDMFLKGVDEYLMNNEIKIPSEHKIELTPEKAFGKREPKMIQLMPSSVFTAQKVNPQQGMTFNFDGRIGKIISVSGGRVRVDFNNPLAGRDVVYDIKILKKVDDKNEQIKALNEFFFRRDFKFEVKDKKLILEAEKGMKQFVELFKDKYKEILDLDLETKEIEKKEPKKEEKTTEK